MSKEQRVMNLNTTTDIIQFIRQRRENLLSQGKKVGYTSLATASRNLVRTLENHESVLAMDCQDGPEPTIDTSKMSAEFIVSTVVRDRHGDIVEPSGCLPHLKNYARNPRIFFAHRTEDLPIASARDPQGNLCLSVDKESGVIRSTAWFHGETPESELIFRLIARKELQAASIGFLPVKAAVLEGEHLQDKTEAGDMVLDFRNTGNPIMHFLEWDMIEWSVVPIPANQEALAAHLGRGHIEGERITPAVRRALSAWVPPSAKTTVGFSNLTKSLPTQDATPGVDPFLKSLEVINSELDELETLELQLEKELESEVKADDEAGKPDPEELDEVFKKYKEETNMSYSDLKEWADNKCSKRASLDNGPISRNLELLSKGKSSWTKKHVKWANKTISFNSRMKGMPRGKPLSQECPWSKRDISLKNWAWDPGKTPKAKKDLEENITYYLPAGPTPGVDLPVMELGDSPAPPKDQITGSDSNKPGSASDDSGKITISKETEKALKNKVEKHNEDVKGKSAWCKTTLGALKAVYRRGAGAYSTSHRPGKTRAQWALARVNAFLYLCKNGKPENEKYISDNDLLHPDHPKHSKDKKDLDALVPPPQQGDEKKPSKTSINSRSVVAFHSYPLAQADTKWNGPRERQSADLDTLKKICAWFDGKKPDVKSSYKFPHHLASSLKTVWSGVRAAMAALLGARGGADIPAGDRKGVYDHLAKHYKEFKKDPPDFREGKTYSEEELKTLFPDLEELSMPYEEDEDKIKAEVQEEEEDKAAEEVEEEKADDSEEAEEKSADEEPKNEDTVKILKGMSEVLNSMHECSSAHTDLLKGLHDKLDNFSKSKKEAEEEEAKNQEEEEMKSLLGSLQQLKSNQDALNKKLFELTGRR